jgi:branched-chain amino acid transport system permease protein
MHMNNPTVQASNKPVNWLWLLLWAAILAYLPVLLTERAFFGIPLTNTQLLNLGLTQINLMLISMLGALSLNYLTGCAGLISIGHAAFFATGAMAAAIFDNQLGLPFPLVLLAAALGRRFGRHLGGFAFLACARFVFCVVHLGCALRGHLCVFGVPIQVL